ncbi:hypothetical protein NBT05_16910 [Aquimarina sp. ERC-38]|uniref:hypothetical protein n=1 Tax=Aquimarina sp. ERC-38 TaxID=2949996 RepID=UPI0022469844|nr:hypothetical protein [Aquimarina sp. ERC-38]UZO80609.1 hypothetical protein NBT05_16910 [Aquimarina sp. ERC-38]
MKEIILNYYQIEKHTAIIAMLIGFSFIVAGSILFWKFRELPLQKGLMYAIFVAGMFFAIGGYAYIFQVNKSLIETELLQNTASELHKNELTRINKVLSSSHKVSSILFTVLYLQVSAFILFHLKVIAKMRLFSVEIQVFI